MDSNNADQINEQHLAYIEANLETIAERLQQLYEARRNRIIQQLLEAGFRLSENAKVLWDGGRAHIDLVVDFIMDVDSDSSVPRIVEIPPELTEFYDVWDARFHMIY